MNAVIPEGDRFTDTLKFRRLGFSSGRVLYECWDEAVYAYAAQQVAAERERTKVLAVWAHNALGVLATLEGEDMEDGGEQLRLLRDRGEKLVKAVLHG